MSIIRGGDKDKVLRRDKNLNKDKKSGDSRRSEGRSRPGSNQGRKHLANTQSQKLSNTQSQRLSSTQSQRISNTQSQRISNTQSQRISNTQSQRISNTQSQRLTNTQSQKEAPANRQSRASLLEKTALKAETAAKKRVIQICVAAAVALFIISVAVVLKMAGDDRSYNAYFLQAQEYYDKAEYENSLVMLRKALDLNSTEDGLLLMADCYLGCGNMEKALEILRTMDVKDPAVAEKITAIEKARQAALAAEKVTVGGEQYPADAKNLILDGRGLGNTAVAELSELYALTNLSAAGNNISDIGPLAKLGGLTMLNLNSNSISDLSPLSGLGMLRTLYLDANPIESFEPLYSLSSLTTLSLRNVSILPEQLTALSQALPNCAIHCETDTEDISEINFGGVSFDTQITEIDLSNLGITDISVLSSCRNLKTLNLSGNYISDISPLMDIPGLEWLNIENNRVSDLRPLMGISSLKVINAQNNSIDSIAALGSLTELTELYLAGNPIRDFSALSKLTGLSTLGLENTGIDDEGLLCADGIESLRYLLLTDNPNLTGNAVDAYKVNNPKCLVYHDKDMVYVVQLGDREFREDVTELEAAYMGLSDISALCGFDKVEKVNLSGNSITDLYCFRWMTAVRVLNLSDNELYDITALSHLENLEVVDLSNNKITSVTPLYMLPNLKEVHLGGNPVWDYQLEELRAYQPDLIIYSD